MKEKEKGSGMGPVSLEWKYESVNHSVVSNSLWPHGLWPARPICPWDSPGKNTGAGRHALLRGSSPTQGLSPGLLHYRCILYCLSHQGSPGRELRKGRGSCILGSRLTGGVDQVRGFRGSEESKNCSVAGRSRRDLHRLPMPPPCAPQLEIHVC